MGEGTMGRKMRVEQLTELNMLEVNHSIPLEFHRNQSSTTCRKAGWCLRNPIKYNPLIARYFLSLSLPPSPLPFSSPNSLGD
jgi:hypothetical protein